jgi:hypothetical protein
MMATLVLDIQYLLTMQIVKVSLNQKTGAEKTSLNLIESYKVGELLRRVACKSQCCAAARSGAGVT